jgi:hypothetical protein
VRCVHSKAARPKMREHLSPLNHLTPARSAFKQQHQPANAGISAFGYQGPGATHAGRRAA